MAMTGDLTHHFVPVDCIACTLEFVDHTDDLFVRKTLLHGDVPTLLMKTLLTSRCGNQRGAGQILSYAMILAAFNRMKVCTFVRIYLEAKILAINT